MRCVNLETCLSRPLDEQSSIYCARFKNIVGPSRLRLVSCHGSLSIIHCDPSKPHNNPFNPAPPLLARSPLFTETPQKGASPIRCLRVCPANILLAVSRRAEATGRSHVVRRGTTDLRIAERRRVNRNEGSRRRSLDESFIENARISVNPVAKS